MSFANEQNCTLRGEAVHGALSLSVADSGGASPAAEAQLPLGLRAPDFKGLSEVDLHSPIRSSVSGECHLVGELEEADGNNVAFEFTSTDNMFVALPNIENHLRLS